MGATLPTQNAMEIINRPSQGSLRAVSTGLFLVSDLAATGEADHLYVTPYDSVLLSGASLPLYTTVMDSAYYPMGSTDNASWSISNGDGTVSANGVFTAGEGSGTTQVTATSGRLSGQATMSVFHTPDTITLSNEDTGAALTSLALEPNQSVNLKASAIYKKLSLVSQDTCYTWSADAAVGTVDQDGVFTATGKSAAGNLTVTAGGKTITIPVTVAGHVIQLDGFEDGVASLTGTDSVSVAAETASDYVRFGEQSAKLTYDTSVAGTASVSTSLAIAASERYLTLWVYGDSSGNALTATVTRGATDAEKADGRGDAVTENVVLTGLDFTGWKRITALLPLQTTALQSLSVTYGGGANASTGVLWLDQLTKWPPLLPSSSPAPPSPPRSPTTWTRVSPPLPSR